MALLAGSLASVTIPTPAGGQTGLVYAMDINFVRALHIVNVFGDASTSKIKRGGMFNMRATIEAHFDADATPDLTGTSPADGIDQVGATGTANFVFTLTSGKTYTVTGLFNVIGFNVQKTGLAIVTMSFVATSAVVVAG